MSERKINLYIYNPNSSGGGFDYALHLSKAYNAHKGIEQCTLVLPVNAYTTAYKGKRILLSDKPFLKGRMFSRLYFVFRSVVNPLLFFYFLLGRKGVVLFNDFDQASSFIWSGLFRLLSGRFTFAVILHDPDRDHYVSNVRFSEFSMKRVMSLMDIAFYHETLPDRNYYQGLDTQFVSIPHGIYASSDNVGHGGLYNTLRDFKGRDLLIAALGNIRSEKNYSLIIEALASVPGLRLLIAGVAANTSVNIEELKLKIRDLSLESRVMFIDKYLDDAEILSVGKAADAFILYYARSFKSQSGILNKVAAFRKMLLFSDNNSPLSQLAKRFSLGLNAQPDNRDALIRMLKDFSFRPELTMNWDGYFSYASWDNHADIAVDVFNQFNRK